MYVVCSDSQYIAKKGTQYVPTDDLSRAVQFPSSYHASSALIKLPKQLYKESNWRIMELFSVAAKKESLNEDDYKGIIDSAFLDNELMNENTNTSTENSMSNDLFSVFDELAEVCRKYNEYIQKVSEELSRLDQELCDVYHYIELEPPMNVVQGYKTYKLLRNILLERRKVKNQLIILKDMSETIDRNKLVTLNGQLHNQKYKPRRLTELFK